MVGLKKGTTPEQNKKVVRLIHFNELNTCIKDEAATTGKTEAAIIENAISDRYLNTSESEMADSVLNCIANENAVNDMCRAVFLYFSAMPSYANKESLVPLLDKCFKMAVCTSSKIDKSIQSLVHFRSQLDSIYKFFKNSYENNIICADTNGFDRVSLDVVYFFEMLIKDIDSVLVGTNEFIDWSSGEIGNIISYLAGFFEFGNVNGVTFGKWTYFYRVMADICEISHWQNSEKNRYDVVKIIKEIKFSDGNFNEFNPNITKLDKTIFLKDKVISTTRDAIVLKTHPNMLENEFTQARRVIHGVNGKDTEKPFILLFTDEDKSSLENKLHELVQMYPNEFPFAEDAYPVQIFSNGKYYDPRIKWNTI